MTGGDAYTGGGCGAADCKHSWSGHALSALDDLLKIGDAHSIHSSQLKKHIFPITIAMPTI